MKWNYIFASCFIAALLLDQTSAGRWGSRSRSRSSSRSSGSSSSGSSRSPSPPGSPSRHRPSSNHVTQYNPANSLFSPQRARSPSSGPSTSSAGSSRPSHLPLAHSASTSSGYGSSYSPNSPHQPSTSGASSSSVNPFARMQNFGNPRHTSPSRGSGYQHQPLPGGSGHQHQPLPGGHRSRPQSPPGGSNSGHNSRSVSPPRSSSPSATPAPENYLPRQSFDPRTRYNTREILQNDAVPIPTNPVTGLVRRKPSHEYHTSDDLSEVPVQQTAMRDFANEHMRLVSSNRDYTHNEKRQKKAKVKELRSKMNTNAPGTSGQQRPSVLTALEYTPPKQQLKKIKCGRPGSTAESCFDYYGFSMLWVPTLHLDSVTIRATAPRENKWVIHGLWPNKKGIIIAPPKECAMKNMRFDISKLSRMTRELNEHWYSINMENERFWKNEWEKHGACAARSIFVNDIEGYFRKALSLRHNVRFEEILRQAGFVPGSKMTLQQIYNAITPHYGAPSIITFKDPTQADDVYYLSEIKVCLNHRFQRMDCPLSKSLDPAVLAQEITYNSMTSVP
ncbi:zinc finger CCCH domain-containing protein 18-like [Microplitis mediator]|uniref:zinc finger CCCH domain-containing protein 18-like n=1 Tax=Microplitis mediator TaxID=375433 RepID=UPI002557248E|nr:zinc finger CCCH domain-containing protein 18-like [Microplitis mediator]